MGVASIETGHRPGLWKELVKNSYQFEPCEFRFEQVNTPDTGSQKGRGCFVHYLWQSSLALLPNLLNIPIAGVIFATDRKESLLSHASSLMLRGE